MHELKLHTTYCESFGISIAEIQATEEKQGKPTSAPRSVCNPTETPLACTAYTRYVLDIGQNGDWLGLQVALAPCLLGYGAVARMLRDHKDTVQENNTYWAWIKNYNEDDYTQAVRLGSGTSRGSFHTPLCED